MTREAPSPKALLLLGVAGVLMAGSLGGSATDLWAQDDANPFATPMDRRAGETLFDRHCSRCHGLGATGGETGPDLTTGQFRHASTDTGLFSVITRGVPDTEMRPFRRASSDQDVWQLVTYLRSLSGGPRVEVPGDPSRGERLYRGKGECSSCHIIDGEGGRHGPDLSEIGSRRSPTDLRSDLVDPDERVQPAWWRMRVVHRDGTTVSGLRMNEGTYSVRILDDDSNLWSFMKRDLAERERIETSSMPSYAGELSDGELEDLIAFLYGLTRDEG